ncbi:MAG: hypothetical protein EPN93_20770 [Spirochaetes bacterium]|nr:MAG: hypothetical protein EPN93_20770 [Spirochaetota bacterium]
MKISRVFAAAFIVVGLASASSCKDSGSWLAKIDGETLSIEEFNGLYYAQHRSVYHLPDNKIDELAADPEQVARNPFLDKQEFLEQVIRQRLVAKKASAEGFRKEKDLQALIETTTDSLVSTYYISEKYKKEIEPTQKEVDDGIVALNNNPRLDPQIKMLPIEKKELLVKQQLMQQKFQMKAREVVENLRDEGKVQKNSELLKKEISKAKDKK